MKMKVKRKLLNRVSTAAAGLLLMSILSGCGNSDMDSLVSARVFPNDSTQSATAEVMKGDLSPVFEATIDLSGYEEIVYRIEPKLFEQMNNEKKMEFDKLLVAEGDRVEAGDVLISFKSEVLDKKLQESRLKKNTAAIEIDHYQRLMAIDPLLDFSSEIENLNNEIMLADLHISDINETYAKMNLVATKPGTVSFVDESMKAGFLVISKPAVKIVSDDGYYIMDMNSAAFSQSSSDEPGKNLGVKPSDIDFKTGKVYDAKTSISDYKVELIDDPTTSATAGDAEKKGDKLYFKLANNEVLKEKSLLLHIELPEVKDVMYVDQRAICSYDGNYYVLKLMENGRLKAVNVTPGESVGQYIVIKNGLEEGDMVSLP